MCCFLATSRSTHRDFPSLKVAHIARPDLRFACVYRTDRCSRARRAGSWPMLDPKTGWNHGL